MKHFSIGNISKSRLWLSLEVRPSALTFISFGPTYNGTIAGVVASFKRVTIIGHIRKVKR